MTADTTIAGFVKLLPAHACELTITHNTHRAIYTTVVEYLSNIGAEDDDFPSIEDRRAAETSGELWEIQWYPRTPVGFYRVFGSTLEKALAYARQTENT